MGMDSKIEWTTHTFNPWRGCTKVAAGCANCYADAQAKRNPGTLGIWGDNGTRVVASEAMWGEPLKWNRWDHRCMNCGMFCFHEGEHPGEVRSRCCNANAVPGRPRVFCASMADVFEDWQGIVSDHRRLGGHVFKDGDWGFGPHFAGEPLKATNVRALTLNDVRRRLFSLIDETPNLDWLLLTKRPENVAKMWPERLPLDNTKPAIHYHRPNVWLGTSIATQEDADRNIPELLECRDLAPVLFLSIEPLVGPVDVVPYIGGNSYQCRKCGDWKRTEIEMAYVGGGSHVCVECGTYCPPGPTIDWVIVGGESGPGARPMHPDWVRSLRDQCVAAGVPFFFKQWGEYADLTNDDDGSTLHQRSTCDEIMLPTGEIIGAGYRSGRQSKGMVDPQWRERGAAWMGRVGKQAAGRLLDGREWNEFPEVAHA